MTASAAPAYLGNPKNVDPEEAYVASLSACHMLTFLAIACKQKFVLDEYLDEPVGHMEKNAEGKLAITKLTLKPKIKFSGDKQPTAEELDKNGSADELQIAALRRDGSRRPYTTTRDVAFEEPADADHVAIDQAYRSKYARYGSTCVYPMVSPHATAATLRLIAR